MDSNNEVWIEAIFSIVTLKNKITAYPNYIYLDTAVKPSYIKLILKIRVLSYQLLMISLNVYQNIDRFYVFTTNIPLDHSFLLHLVYKIGICNKTWLLRAGNILLRFCFGYVFKVFDFTRDRNVWTASGVEEQKFKQALWLLLGYLI